MASKMGCCSTVAGAGALHRLWEIGESFLCQLLRNVGLFSIHSSLIVLYAVPLDASNTHRTPSQLAKDIFGINTNETQDPVNARSQVLRCSRGQLNYIPACGTSGQACYPFVNQSVYFVDGVLQVPINYNIAGVASGTVKNG